MSTDAIIERMRKAIYLRSKGLSFEIIGIYFDVSSSRARDIFLSAMRRAYSEHKRISQSACAFSDFTVEMAAEIFVQREYESLPLDHIARALFERQQSRNRRQAKLRQKKADDDLHTAAIGTASRVITAIGHEYDERGRKFIYRTNEMVVCPLCIPQTIREICLQKITTNYMKTNHCQNHREA